MNPFRSLAGQFSALRGPLGALRLGAVAAAALLLVPIAVLIGSAWAPGTGTWAHLAQTVLPDYVLTTSALLAGVAAGVLLLGVGSAWLVTAYRFPGARTLEWVLILPLAVPAYVIAYAYTDVLQFSGPVQGALRELTGWRARDYWFPDIRSTGGAALVFSVVLYPYVYLLTRAAFLEQSASLIEAGRLLGRGAWGTFVGVALPLARPAIAVGASLALMETLADFGAVSYFGVQTFTTGIYRAWLSLGDTVAAAQLSLVLLAFVALLLAAEQWNRGRARFHNLSARPHARPRVLRGARAVAAFSACALPPLLGFFVPGAILIGVVAGEAEPLFTPRFLALTQNTFVLAGITSLVAVALATMMAYAARLSRTPLVFASNRLAALGYAIPGAVIALGILVPVARLDNLLADWARAHYGINLGLLLTGSVAVLIYAYLVRFLAIALHTVEAGLGKIRPSMEDAARSLGLTPAQTLARVHAPIMSRSLATAGLIVFVDVMKELPATFALRPFNFDTLAVQAYNMAKDERLAEAAAASLVIVAVALVPLFVLARSIAKGRGHEA